jgi:hypothetical protein
VVSLVRPIVGVALICVVAVTVEALSLRQARIRQAVIQPNEVTSPSFGLQP